MQIVKSVHHLVEVGSGHFLRELASVSNEVEELSSSHVLQHNGKTIVCSLIFFLIGGVFSHADEFYQILVVQLLHDVELMLQSLEGGGFLFVLLDGDESARLVFAEFNSKWMKEYCAW